MMKKIKKFVIGASILGIMALPMIACSDNADYNSGGDIGTQARASQTQTAQLPHLSGGHMTNNTPVPFCLINCP